MGKVRTYSYVLKYWKGNKAIQLSHFIKFTKVRNHSTTSASQSSSFSSRFSFLLNNIRDAVSYKMLLNGWKTFSVG